MSHRAKHGNRSPCLPCHGISGNALSSLVGDHTAKCGRRIINTRPVVVSSPAAAFLQFRHWGRAHGVGCRSASQNRQSPVDSSSSHHYHRHMTIAFEGISASPGAVNQANWSTILEEVRGDRRLANRSRLFLQAVRPLIGI